VITREIVITTRPIDPSRVDPDRFWSKVDRSQPHGCWEWTASRFSDGYGQFSFDGDNYPAHRIAWALGNAACLLPGWVIRHGCDNPPCCNPAHLQPGTIAENHDDMLLRGRSVRGRPRPMPTGPGAAAWSEHCRRDHDPALRYLTKDGKRRCRACDRLVARAGYRRRKASL